MRCQKIILLQSRTHESTIKCAAKEFKAATVVAEAASAVTAATTTTTKRQRWAYHRWWRWNKPSHSECSWLMFIFLSCVRVCVCHHTEKKWTVVWGTAALATARCRGHGYTNTVDWMCWFICCYFIFYDCCFSFRFIRQTAPFLVEGLTCAKTGNCCACACVIATHTITCS